MQEITITLNSTLPNVAKLLVDNEGVKQSKSVTIETALNMLNQSMDGSENLKRIGKMPEGYVDAFFDLEKLSGKVAVHVKRHLQPLNFAGEMAIIPFPSIILVYSFRNGMHQKTVAFATKEDSIRRISYDTVLYNYPFGNVAPGTGAVCWGSNRHEKLNSLTDINLFTDKFLNSETNRDLYQTGISNGSKKELPLLLQDLQAEVEKAEKEGKEALFNDALLVPTTHTLENVLFTSTLI